MLNRILAIIITIRSVGSVASVNVIDASTENILN